MLGEAIHEAREALRGPMVPLMGAGLTGYLLLVLNTAEYLQEMGATDIPRNSPHLIYLMTAGQAFWLVFAWAWMFSRVVVRDKDANLHEMVLASPAPLHAIYIGRWLGATAVASLLGASSMLGFVLIEPLGAAGLIQPSASGPTPWFILFESWLLLCVPIAMGLGALFVLAALKTRSAVGSFAVAGAIVALWMASMIILRGGDIAVDFAILLDPTCFAEIESQSLTWTPAEKRAGVLEWSGPLLLNRVVWFVLPVVAFAIGMLRMHRETLVIGSTSKAREEVESTLTSADHPLPGPVEAPQWLAAAWSESRWQLQRVTGSFGLRFIAALLLAMGTASQYVHVVAHAQGPLVPRTELVTGLLGEFFYLIVIFVVAGFVGTMMRRDDQRGIDELIACTPAPLLVRVLGKWIAALVLTVAVTCIPMVAGYIVVALAEPSSLSLSTPPVFWMIAYVPALLELAGITIALHACIRRPGPAHALSMVAAFALVLSNELQLTTYPPAKLGIPASLTLSELVGLSPFLGWLTAAAVFKLLIFVAAGVVAWIAWRRDVESTPGLRVRIALARLRGPAGLTMAAVTAGLFAMLALFERELVDSGQYETAAEERAAAAAWERTWARRGGRVELDGGSVAVSVEPDAQVASVVWTLRQVRTPDRQLHLELPFGVGPLEATAQGESLAVERAADHAAVSLGACADASGCDVRLAFDVAWVGWRPFEGETPWMHASGVWGTSNDLLPRLGLDPDRMLRVPSQRREQGLPDLPPALDRHGAVYDRGVAPAGDWTVEIALPTGWSLQPPSAFDGPLEFVLAWRPEAPLSLEGDGTVVWHGRAHAQTAAEILEDVEEVHHCVDTLLGGTPGPRAVLQAPRHTEPAVVGDALWLPEDPLWDVDSEGHGRWHRRLVLGRLLARDTITRRAEMQRHPGSRWLSEGVPGWVALHCSRALDGADAWHAMLERSSDEVAQDLSASVGPVEELQAGGSQAWVQSYAGVATASWADAVGTLDARAVLDEVIGSVRGGSTVEAALVTAVGADTAAALLGRPRATDVQLAAAPNGTVVARGARSTWRDGGWHEDGEATEVTVHRAAGAPSVVDVDRPLDDTTMTVLDAWPSFERSIDDNVWPRKGEG
ncbi:MAG: ABC transporter permease [Myxococcota bacterium]